MKCHLLLPIKGMQFAFHPQRQSGHGSPSVETSLSLNWLPPIGCCSWPIRVHPAYNCQGCSFAEPGKQECYSGRFKGLIFLYFIYSFIVLTYKVVNIFCLNPKISISTEPIWFSISGNHHIGLKNKNKNYYHHHHPLILYIHYLLSLGYYKIVIPVGFTFIINHNSFT